MNAMCKRGSLTKPDLHGIISLMISIARLPEILTRGILSLIYPPRCQLCGKGLDLFSGKVLCEICRDGIILNTPSGYDGCKTNAHYFDASYSVCVYEGAIRECIHNFKYNGKLAIEKLFKGLMIEFAEKHIDMRRFDWLIPVPLHRVKYRERTFNQSTILAVHLSRRFRISMLNNNLTRTRMGDPQMMLSKNKRLKDIKGSFRIQNPILLKDKTVLLIDDVFTTGATVNECSKVIKEAGAALVEVFTLARAK